MKKTLLLILMLAVCGIIYFKLFSEKACGGFAGETGIAVCAPLFKCQYKNRYPDAQGKCIFIQSAILNRFILK